MADFFHLNKKGVIIGLLIVVLLVAVASLIVLARDANTGPGVNLTYELGYSSINISHQGGEPLGREDLFIFLDENPVTRESASLLYDEEWPFSIGETLIVHYAPSDRSRVLSLRYKGSSSRNQIFSAHIPKSAPDPGRLPVTSAAIPGTPATSPTPTPTPAPNTTPGIPEAMFAASPREGPVPLTVQFLDQSTGVPGSWSWTFGDGGESAEQNPQHTYIREGTYSVSLNAVNAYGAHTRIVQQYISVTPASPTEVAISAETEGFIRPDGFAQFRITGPGSRIKIGGRVVRPEPGEEIRLVVKGDGKGSISIADGQISDFTFDSVDLVLDGGIAGSGALQEIYIPSFADLLTTLVLEVPPSGGPFRITTDGETEVIREMESPVILIHLMPDDSGRIVLDTKSPYQVTYRGAAGSIHY